MVGLTLPSSLVTGRGFFGWSLALRSAPSGPPPNTIASYVRALPVT
jgi:hypothetical protein